MTRNIETLGRVLVAVLALSAVVASAAGAEEFDLEVEEAPATLSGEQDGESVDVFTVSAGTVECEKVSFSTTMEEFVETTIEVEPAYSNCTASPLGTATVDMNGCVYRFVAGEIESEAYEGTIDVVCEAEQEIEVTVTALETLKCTVDIPTQSALGTVTYTNLGEESSGEVTVDINIEESVEYTQTAGIGIGACPSESGSEGSYTGEHVVRAEDEAAEQAGLSVQEATAGVLDLKPEVLEFTSFNTPMKMTVYNTGTRRLSTTEFQLPTGYTGSNTCTNKLLHPKGDKKTRDECTETIECIKKFAAGKIWVSAQPGAVSPKSDVTCTF